MGGLFGLTWEQDKPRTTNRDIVGSRVMKEEGPSSKKLSTRLNVGTPEAEIPPPFSSSDPGQHAARAHVKRDALNNDDKSMGKVDPTLRIIFGFVGRWINGFVAFLKVQRILIRIHKHREVPSGGAHRVRESLNISVRLTRKKASSKWVLLWQARQKIPS